MELGR